MRIRNYSQRDYHKQKEHSHQFTIRMAHEDFAQLKELARVKRTSISEYIRTCVEWGFENDATPELFKRKYAP